MKPQAKDWNKKYTQGRRFTKTNSKFIASILRFAKKRYDMKIKNAADLGCGTGDLAIKLAKLGPNVMCMDFSSVALEIARRDAKKSGVISRIKFIKRNLEKLSTFEPPKLFDLAINQLTLGFISNKKKFIASVKRLLKPNGIFVLITPVLLPRLAYSKHSKAISVKKYAVERLLKSAFKKYVIFHKRPFGEHDLEITYIAQNKSFP